LSRQSFAVIARVGVAYSCDVAAAAGDSFTGLMIDVIVRLSIN